MSADPITGRTVRWSYVDGPVAGKHFEHVFAADGTERFREVDGAAPSGAVPYQVARIGDDVFEP